jgi:hypothetical protein
VSQSRVCARRSLSARAGENLSHVVWQCLHDEAGEANPKYFGFDGARARFLCFFPNGFHSAGYTNAERDYKIAAKQRLDETAPLEQAVSASGLGEAILAVFRATNLLSPFQKVRLQDVLRGPTADEFIRAAARFTLLGGFRPSASLLQRHAASSTESDRNCATARPIERSSVRLSS